MEFSSLYLSIDDRKPMRNDFKNFSTSFAEQVEKNYMLISTEVTESYFWLYACFDTRMPRSDVVMNATDFSLEENPRTADQIEPRKQLFSLYDIQNDVLYISNIKKKKLLEELLKKYIEGKIVIKNLIKNIDDFYRQISSIQKITFSSVERDLFSGKGLIQQSLADNYGMEEPELFSVEAVFKQSLSERIKHTISCLLQQKEEGKLKKIIIQGLDEQGFETIFNEGSFVNKIRIDCSEEEETSGMLEENVVKSFLLKRLGINV